MASNLWLSEYWHQRHRHFFNSVQISPNNTDLTEFNTLASQQRLYSVSQKIPSWGFLTFFQNGWEFLHQILHTYCRFPSKLGCKLLSNYPQFWRSYAIFKRDHPVHTICSNVHHQPKRTLAFSDIFSKQLGIFGPIHQYNKLCLIKRDHHYMFKISIIGWNARWVVALNPLTAIMTTCVVTICVLRPAGWRRTSSITDTVCRWCSSDQCIIV